MRHARALLPYAVSALIVVGASVATLGLAVADLRDAREAAVDRPSSLPSAAPRAFPELSRTGRLAYWRGDTTGTGGDLTVANLDGTLRRPLARTATTRRIALTRWTPDGEAVAYVENGVTLVLARLDGTRAEMTLPDDVRVGGGRITEHRWTADGTRVAVTVVRADLRSDMYSGRVADRSWIRATDLDDVFVAEWIDNDQVLVYTGGGIIGVLRPGVMNAIRPITGMPATSPFIADDGRVHFLTGAITPSPRDISYPYLTANRATVWSIGIDGSQPRSETQNPLDDVRLDGRYGPGTYLAHRGSSQLQVLLSEAVNVPATEAGPAERIVVAPDGRSAVGFSASRIVRFDVTRSVAAGSLGPPTVMLDSALGGDVWHPRPVSTARHTAGPTPEGLAARYAFVLGGHLWTMGPDGVASFVRRLPFSRRTPPPPAWSPRGDRVLTVQLAGIGLAGVTAATPIAVSIDRDGGLRPYVESRAATATPTWSPSGDAFAVVVDRRGVDGASAQAELEVRFLGLDGSVTRPAIPARDASWTRAGVVLLTDTAITVSDGAGIRTVTELSRILTDPRGGFAADRSSATFSSLAATSDGAFLSLRMVVTPSNGINQFAVAVIRVADGAVTAFLPGTPQDLRWSPAGRLLGATRGGSPESAAEVRDAASGAVIATQPGRFAGWSPDGAWYYVARAEGLFAFRAEGGAAIRVSAIGVPVSTTPP